MIFHGSLSDCKSPQVTRNLLDILADLKNAVVWIVSIRPPVSHFPVIFSMHFGIVTRTPITLLSPSLSRPKTFLVLRQGLRIGIIASFRWFSLLSDATVKSTIQRIIFIIIMIVTTSEFFISANADNLSLEFEWLQISSSL